MKVWGKIGKWEKKWKQEEMWQEQQTKSRETKEVAQDKGGHVSLGKNRGS
jgi:hypothetical protein